MRYIGYLKLYEKRKLEEQVRVGMMKFINIFAEEDKPHVLKALCYAYSLSEYIVSFFIAALFFSISYYLSAYNYRVFSVIIYIALLLLKTNYNELRECKAHITFLPVSEKSNYKFFRLIFRFTNRNALLILIFPYVIGLFVYGYVSGSLYSTSIYLLISSSCLYLVSLGYYFLFNIIGSPYGNNLIKALFVRRKEKLRVKEYKRKNFDLLYQRAFDINFKAGIVKIISSILFVIISICFLVLNGISNNAVQLFLLITWAFLPSILYALVISVLYADLFNQDYIFTTYYLIKKYNLQGQVTKSLIRSSLKNSLFYLLPLGGLLLISLNNVYAVVASLICIIHCFNILILSAVRIHKYTKYSFDLLNSNVILKMLSEPFEDYILLGLPIIMLSYNILECVRKGSISSFAIYYLVFVLIVILYVSIKISLTLRRKRDAVYRIS